MSREHLTPDPGLDKDVIARSTKRQQDDVYALPIYVEAFIKATQAVLPKGWRCLPWTINRSVTIRNGRNFIMKHVTYEGIESGYTFKIEDVM